MQHLYYKFFYKPKPMLFKQPLLYLRETIDFNCFGDREAAEGNSEEKCGRHALIEKSSA